MSAAAQVQEAEPIVVWVGRDGDGAHFVLHPFTIRDLERVYPEVERFPQVSIRRGHTGDFAALSEAVQAHVVALLTGQRIETWSAQGEVRFMDPARDLTLAVWPRDRR